MKISRANFGQGDFSWELRNLLPVCTPENITRYITTYLERHKTVTCLLQQSSRDANFIL